MKSHPVPDDTEFLAGAIERLKDLLPTDLGSAEIRHNYAQEILERSVVSARMLAKSYLATVRETCADLLDGAINEATARDTLEAELERLGFSMDDPSIKNHASLRRINLVIDTQTKMASSLARLAEQTDSVLALWPAWRLERHEPRSVPRTDWRKRWLAAGDAVDWKGALKPGLTSGFVALKDSPVWQALGDGAGGFSDTLGNPYPPFAYGSGMGWSEVSADETASLGLADSSQPSVDGRSVSGLSPSELLDSARRHGIIV